MRMKHLPLLLLVIFLVLPISSSAMDKPKEENIGYCIHFHKIVPNEPVYLIVKNLTGKWIHYVLRKSLIHLQSQTEEVQTFHGILKPYGFFKTKSHKMIFEQDQLNFSPFKKPSIELKKISQPQKKRAHMPIITECQTELEYGGIYEIKEILDNLLIFKADLPLSKI